MKTSWGKPVHVIAFIRTLLIVLAVAVCTVAAEDIETMRKAAEAGDAKAQLSLAAIYAIGRRVPQDYAEAQYNLGLMYALGKGVPGDYVAAYAWFSVASASGSDEAREARGSIKRDLTPSQLEKGEAMATEIFERIEKRKAAKAE